MENKNILGMDRIQEEKMWKNFANSINFLVSKGYSEFEAKAFIFSMFEDDDQLLVIGSEEYVYRYIVFTLNNKKISDDDYEISKFFAKKAEINKKVYIRLEKFFSEEPSEILQSKLLLNTDFLPKPGDDNLTSKVQLIFMSRRIQRERDSDIKNRIASGKDQLKFLNAFTY